MISLLPIKLLIDTNYKKEVFRGYLKFKEPSKNGIFFLGQSFFEWEQRFRLANY